MIARLKTWMSTDLDQYFDQPERPLVPQPLFALGVLLAMVAVGLLILASSMELQYGYQLGIKLAGAGATESTAADGEAEGSYISLIMVAAAASAAIIASCVCFWLNARNNREVE